MFSPFLWIFGARRSHDRSRRRAQPRRLGFEHCEARVVMDAQGLLGAAELSAPALVLHDRCQAAAVGEGESLFGPEGSLGDPQVGVVYPLQDGKQLIFDSADTARVVDADQRESVFVQVEVVVDPNRITLFPHGGSITTLIAPYTPPGKVLLGERFETLDGEFIAWAPADPGVFFLELVPIGRGMSVRRYAIWGIAPQWDVDGSQTVDAADLLAVVNRVREARQQQSPSPDAGSPAVDLTQDGVLNQADVLAMARQLRSLTGGGPFSVSRLVRVDDAS